MSDSSVKAPTGDKYKNDSEIRAIVEIVQWLLIALILALYFRGFVMEAYRIPTGSMATTLKGAHFRLRCRQCGYRFDRDFECAKYDLPGDTLPASGKAVPNDCVCPSCGNDMTFVNPVYIANGDRILVLKCLYQFLEPNRWDVIVFRDPSEPRDNIIKRLVGLPGEKIQIVNGDIYINGKIARKDENLQEKLWIAVYNNDYQPVQPDRDSFNGRKWENPFRNYKGSNWRIDETDKTKFVLDGGNKELHWLEYDSSLGNDFKADIAYNGTSFRKERPYYSDIMVRFCSESNSDDFTTGARISRYGQVYCGWTEGDKLIIGRVNGSSIKVLAETAVLSQKSEPAIVSFSVVDRFIEFKFGNRSVGYNLESSFEQFNSEQVDIAPEVWIFGSGELVFSHLAIYRDIYYTEQHYYGGGEARAAGKDGFYLGRDEYFVLGDNSPASFDSRWWTKSGYGNNGTVYSAGIVPRDYLLGKAVFVYWPSGFRPFGNFGKAIIPNIGQMRFIHGGTEKK
ncbi:MAG: signal peptidase I [Sedimentisphaerales bacterium]|nr:signal peptidase I [Sedimentisphaerales bacterium]